MRGAAGCADVARALVTPPCDPEGRGLDPLAQREGHGWLRFSFPWLPSLGLCQRPSETDGVWVGRCEEQERNWRIIVPFELEARAPCCTCAVGAQVRVGWGCHNKGLPTGWLPQQKCMVWQFCQLKSEVQVPQGWFFLETLWRPELGRSHDISRRGSSARVSSVRIFVLLLSCVRVQISPFLKASVILD